MLPYNTQCDTVTMQHQLPDCEVDQQCQNSCYDETESERGTVTREIAPSATKHGMSDVVNSEGFKSFARWVKTPEAGKFFKSILSTGADLVQGIARGAIQDEIERQENTNIVGQGTMLGPPVYYPAVYGPPQVPFGYVPGYGGFPPTPYQLPNQFQQPYPYQLQNPPNLPQNQYQLPNQSQQPNLYQYQQKNPENELQSQYNSQSQNQPINQSQQGISANQPPNQQPQNQNLPQNKATQPSNPAPTKSSYYAKSMNGDLVRQTSAYEELDDEAPFPMEEVELKLREVHSLLQLLQRYDY